MKMIKFETRWQQEELEAFLLRDGDDIVIKHITDSEYETRIYYNESVSGLSRDPSREMDRLLDRRDIYMRQSSRGSFSSFFRNLNGGV